MNANKSATICQLYPYRGVDDFNNPTPGFRRERRPPESRCRSEKLNWPAAHDAIRRLGACCEGGNAGSFLRPVATKWRNNIAPGKSSRVPRALTPPGVIGLSNSSAEQEGRPTRGGPPRPKQAAVISASANRVVISRCMARPMIINLSQPRAAKMLVELACCLPGAIYQRHFAAVTVFRKRRRQFIVDGTSRSGAVSSG